jgi:hypothetical protein
MTDDNTLIKMITFKKHKPLVLKEKDDNDIIELIRSSNVKKDFVREVLMFFQSLTNKLTEKTNIYFAYALINGVKWYSHNLIQGSKLINNKTTKLKEFITNNTYIEVIIFLYNKRLFNKYSNVFKFVSENITPKVSYDIINKVLLKEMDKYKKENNLYKYTKKLYKFYLNNNKIASAKDLQFIYTKELKKIYKFIENINNCVIILESGYGDIDTIIKIKTSVAYCYTQLKALFAIQDERKDEYFNMMNTLSNEPHLMIVELRKIYDFFINELNKVFAP